MKYFSKQSLPYLQKLVMVSLVIITLFLPIVISAESGLAATESIMESTSGALGQSLAKQEGSLTINLIGVASYELVEIFNDVIESTPGVITARRCRLQLDSKRPRSCRVEWQVKFAGTTPFALESAIYHRLKKISAEPAVSRVVNGSTITLDDDENRVLKAVKPWQSTAGSLRFIETETFSDNLPQYRLNHRHPYGNRWSNYPNYGFE